MGFIWWIIFLLSGSLTVDPKKCSLPGSPWVGTPSKSSTAPTEKEGAPQWGCQQKFTSARKCLGLTAPAAVGTPIIGDGLGVWRMGRGMRQENHLLQLSPDVRDKS